MANHNISVPENWLLCNSEAGATFLTEKSSNYLTAIAGKYGRKITTERMIATTITGNNPVATTIVRVTIIS